MSIEEIREAKDELIKISADKKQRELYEMRAKILKDKVSALNEAERKGIKKGLKEGLEKARRTIFSGNGYSIKRFQSSRRTSIKIFY